MVKVAAALFLFLLSINGSIASTQARIGVIDVQDPWFYVGTIGPTLEHLRKTLPQYRFVSEEMGYANLRSAIEAGELDFFIAPSGFFGVAEEKNGARHLATQERPQSVDPAHSAAGTIVVRKNSKFRTLADLKGARVASDSALNFQSWITVLGEIHRLGEDPDEFWGEKIFTEHQLPHAVSIVLAGEADAAVLSACELESLEELGVVPQGSVRVLNAQTDGLSCLHSTASYPGFVFAGLPAASSQMVKDVTVALLTMKELPDGSGWGFASNFNAVKNLYKDLRLGPYEYLRTWSARALWEQWSWVFWLAAAGVIVAFVHIVRTNRLVRTRTRELREAIEERDRMERQAREDREKLSQLERSGVVSQLSAMLAHEVRQPVAAIVNYAGGLLQYLRSLRLSDPIIEEAGNNIVEDAKKISDIVERVRSYARERTRKKEIVRLDFLLSRALRTFGHSSLSTVCKVQASAFPEAWIEADALEIELVVVNWLRNAAAAVEHVQNPEISIALTGKTEGKRYVWQVIVKDNGPALSDEQFDRLFHPAVSSKPQGLGLGLSLCRLIVERHSGRLSFQRAAGCGLTAVLELDAVPCRQGEMS